MTVASAFVLIAASLMLPACVAAAVAEFASRRRAPRGFDVLPKREKPSV